MHKTKIEWADSTWNPITGCKHGCPYCYAERLTKRFAGDVRLNKSETEHYSKTETGFFILDKPFPTRNDRNLAYPFGFEPTFHKYRLKDLDKWKNGVNIFVCSMADLFGEWVPTEWIQEVFEQCRNFPQHNYLFLTKNPTRYEILDEEGILPKEENFWYGSTITDGENGLYFGHSEYHCFLSIEPLLGDVESFNVQGIDWVLIGAESGNRKGKVVPEKSWVERISCYCKMNGIPLFMKDSLLDVMGNNFVTEMPKILNKKKPSKKHSANCMECGANQRKSDMTYILTREGKERGAKSVGSVCPECMKNLLLLWEQNGMGEGRNDKPREDKEDEVE